MVVVNKRGVGGTAAMDYYLTVPADGISILAFTIGHAAELATQLVAVVLMQRSLIWPKQSVRSKPVIFCPSWCSPMPG